VAVVDIKKYIKEPAVFKEYRKGNIWYTITCEDDEVFDFPVPIDDVGDGIFGSVEKGILLMRYIRKHLETIANGSLV
jgi:hypothetical protein